MHDEKKAVVLVVEDEHSLRQVLRDKLTREGCVVLEARNGEEGFTIALREHPDLILLDIVMPIMDGVAMLRKLREDSWGKDAPVIMLTNLNENDKVAQVMELGSYEYFIKSDHSLEDMLRTVKQKISQIHT